MFILVILYLENRQEEVAFEVEYMYMMMMVMMMKSRKKQFFISI